MSARRDFGGSQNCLSQKGQGALPINLQQQKSDPSLQGHFLLVALPQRQRVLPWEWVSRSKPIGPLVLVLVLVWQRPLIHEAEAGNADFFPA